MDVSDWLAGIHQNHIAGPRRPAGKLLHVALRADCRQVKYKHGLTVTLSPGPLYQVRLSKYFGVRSTSRRRRAGAEDVAP